MATKEFKEADVASHKSADSLWITIDGGVYDVTKFADEHPGGKKSKYLVTVLYVTCLTICVQSSSALAERMPASRSGSTIMSTTCRFMFFVSSLTPS